VNKFSGLLKIHFSVFDFQKAQSPIKIAPKKNFCKGTTKIDAKTG
jgi:hypothetical protein